MKEVSYIVLSQKGGSMVGNTQRLDEQELSGEYELEEEAALYAFFLEECGKTSEDSDGRITVVPLADGNQDSEHYATMIEKDASQEYTQHTLEHELIQAVGSMERGKEDITHDQPRDNVLLLAIDPYQPTTARPGSEEKVQVLAARYEAGIPLWNKRDCDYEIASEKAASMQAQEAAHARWEKERRLKRKHKA